MKLTFMDFIGIGHFLTFVPLGLIFNNGYSTFTGIFFGLLWIGVGKIMNYTKRQEELREQANKSKSELGPEFMSFNEWRNKK